MEWSAVLIDPDWNLLWVSRSLRGFLHAEDDADLGYGLNIVQAWTKEVWMRTATPESQLQLFHEMAPWLLTELASRGQDLQEILPEPFVSLVDQVEPAPDPLPLLWSNSFEYQDPVDSELPTYRVNFCGFRLNDDGGDRVGVALVFFSDVNPNLMQLLVRGDQEMHQRMARLVDPQPREAVVLFCDLHESGRLSRELSSAAYFRLVRRLWTGIDGAIAAEGGIVGKHAGDGASAFFLSEDLGSPSAAAASAIRTARRIHETSAGIFRDAVDTECLMKVGMHWGGSLFMGQLVPGGRLDVTALGDEVNEAARVQECARPGATLATKSLLQRLEPSDARELGIDPDAIRFTPLSDLDGVTDKARRDAALVAVTTLQ
jgi:class 3 adenylate cyclase